MPDDEGVLRRVAWQEVLPWLLIPRAFRLAISPPILFLATLGWLLTPLGPLVAAKLFLPADQQQVLAFRFPAPSSRFNPPLPNPDQLLSPGGQLTSNPLVHVYRRLLLDPVLGVLNPDATIGQTAYYAFTGLWNVAVWSIFGIAILRVAAVRLGREERVSLHQAVHFALQRYSWSALAPLFPCFGIAFASAGIACLGLLMWMADFGVLLSGLAWPLVLIVGLGLAVLLTGLLAGWPLMWPTVASEQYGDAFEAFSRSFSYAFQRPLHYLFYIAVASLLGGLGWLLVSAVAEAVVQLPLYAASWGAGRERMVQIVNHQTEGILGAGAWLIWLWNSLVRSIAVAFQFAYFFCVSAAIYLLLRRGIDETDFDEVYVEEEGSRYSLPPLQANADGVPNVAEGRSSAASDDRGD